MQILLNKILSGFDYENKLIDQNKLSKVAAIVELKDRFTQSSETEQESDIIKEQLSHLLSDVIMQFMDDYLKLFESSKSKLKTEFSRIAAENVSKEFDELFTQKNKSNPSKAETKEKDKKIKLPIEEIGVSVAETIASGINSISDTIRKKLHKSND